MKTTLLLTALLGLSITSRSEDYWEEMSITGDDLIKMLELDVRKYTVKFDKPTYVSLKFESFSQDQEWLLEYPQTEVSVLVYFPEHTEQSRALPGINKMTLMIRGESHGQSIMSYGTYEEAKVKFTTINNLGGFEMVGKESRDAEEAIYRLYVIKHDQKPAERE